MIPKPLLERKTTEISTETVLLSTKEKRSPELIMNWVFSKNSATHLQ